MERKTVIKAAVLGVIMAIAGYAAVMLFAKDAASALLSGLDRSLKETPAGVYFILIVVIVLVALFPFLRAWYLKREVGVFSGKKDKIFRVEDSLKAARMWLGSVRHLDSDIFLYDQVVDPPTADTPFACFCFVTRSFGEEPTSPESGFDDKHKIFLDVNRRTNEVTCNSNVKDWGANSDFLNQLRLIAVPFAERKKESEYERLVKEKMLGGFAEEKGKQAASSDKKKEGDRSDSKKD